ncbi:unnamed protein product [Cuscuta campestris]|uniref:Uncharacterized protein n=1 Tax=Cuscuta campestris TaxID=132261 RepID=A0A484MXB1_9ASTE|nr:unnamed protein product [Cuscuta campestris]
MFNENKSSIHAQEFFVPTLKFVVKEIEERGDRVTLPKSPIRLKTLGLTAINQKGEINAVEIPPKNPRMLEVETSCVNVFPEDSSVSKGVFTIDNGNGYGAIIMQEIYVNELIHFLVSCVMKGFIFPHNPGSVVSHNNGVCEPKRKLVVCDFLLMCFRFQNSKKGNLVSGSDSAVGKGTMSGGSCGNSESERDEGFAFLAMSAHPSALITVLREIFKHSSEQHRSFTIFDIKLCGQSHRPIPTILLPNFTATGLMFASVCSPTLCHFSLPSHNFYTAQRPLPPPLETVFLTY